MIIGVFVDDIFVKGASRCRKAVREHPTEPFHTKNLSGSYYLCCELIQGLSGSYSGSHRQLMLIAWYPYVMSQRPLSLLVSRRPWNSTPADYSSKRNACVHSGEEAIGGWVWTADAWVARCNVPRH